MLDIPHPDVDYIRQHNISLVLSKGLTETFKAKPLEPKKYFAQYLLNIAAQRRNEKQVSLLNFADKALTRWTHALFEYRASRAVSFLLLNPCMIITLLFRSYIERRRARDRRKEEEDARGQTEDPEDAPVGQRQRHRRRGKGQEGLL